MNFKEIEKTCNTQTSKRKLDFLKVFEEFKCEERSFEVAYELFEKN